MTHAWFWHMIQRTPSGMRCTTRRFISPPVDILQRPTVRDAFLFPYGSTVLWGFPSRQELEFNDLLAPCAELPGEYQPFWMTCFTAGLFNNDARVRRLRLTSTDELRRIVAAHGGSMASSGDA